MTKYAEAPLSPPLLVLWQSTPKLVVFHKCVSKVTFYVDFPILIESFCVFSKKFDFLLTLDRVRQASKSPATPPNSQYSSAEKSSISLSAKYF